MKSLIPYGRNFPCKNILELSGHLKTTDGARTVGDCRRQGGGEGGEEGEEKEEGTNMRDLAGSGQGERSQGKLEEAHGHGTRWDFRDH